MYKKLMLLSLFLGVFFCFSKAQENTQLSTIYFIRSTGISGGAGAFSAFIDDSLACHLNNNCYSIHFVTSGLHKLQARFDGRKPKEKIQTLDILMEPNETYYISMSVTNHGFYTNLYLIEVTKNTAQKMFLTLNEDNNCK